jgi:hypothetical protein
MELLAERDPEEARKLLDLMICRRYPSSFGSCSQPSPAGTRLVAAIASCIAADSSI